MTDFSRNISVVKDILRRLSAVFRGDMNINILVSTRIEPETFGMIDQLSVMPRSRSISNLMDYKTINNVQCVINVIVIFNWEAEVIFFAINYL